jgi:two-component system, NtrC family, nitrogen regulation sensor histidine kinase NtrY
MPTLDQMTDVIVRQTNDLRRIVDEFSKFARMPEPRGCRTDLAALCAMRSRCRSRASPGDVSRADLPRADPGGRGRDDDHRRR